MSGYISSIDGKSSSLQSNQQLLPFVLRSTLNAHMPILTTAYFKAIADGADVEKSIEAISARFKIISLVNEHISDQSKGLTDEALAAVMSMAYI